MKYKVINRFRDLENDLVPYVENEEYPKSDAPFPTNDRIKELVSKGFIEKIKDDKKEVIKNDKKI